MRRRRVKKLKGYKVEKLEDPGQEHAFLTFEDLEVYKKAREFRKRMYAVARKLPDFEKYDLGRQIRRAAVSLTNNIAEDMVDTTFSTKANLSCMSAVRFP